MIQIVVVCDILEDLRLEVKVENDVGSFTTTLEIVLRLYPNTGISALIRDMTWLQDNICPIVGVAGAVVFLVILLAQLTIMLRHKRHGCQSFESDGKICVKL